jgi:hypothetical protein
MQIRVSKMLRRADGYCLPSGYGMEGRCGEWHRIPIAAQLRNRIIFPTPHACRPLCFSAPALLFFALASHHPNYSTRSLLRLPVPHSLVFAIVLFPFPCSESLLLSQLIFVAVVVYRFFLSHFSHFRFSYPPFLSELSNYLSAQFSSFSNFPIK